MAEGFNLARRLSSRNENDLMQEDFMDDSASTRSPAFDKQHCIKLVDKVCPSSPLPAECQKYPDVLMTLQRRDSDRHDHNIAFAGMSPGEKASAMAAREKGRLSQAQIKRRLTSPSDKHSSWW